MSRRSGRATAHCGPLQRELRALYDEADTLMAGWSCDASTACCRFGVTGREPYVTSIELEVLQDAIAARGGKLPHRAPPLSENERLALGGRPRGAERTCPLLGAQGRCAVYEARPLGCRTYFCERARRPGRYPRAQIRSLVARLEALAERHAPGGAQGRPLGRIVGV